MPIDPRMPAVAGDLSGVAGRLSDLERRIRLLTTRSGQLGATEGRGVLQATWDGTTGFSSFETVSGLGQVLGIVASCDIASNAKLVIPRVLPGSDLIIAYTADGSIPANGTYCNIYYTWWT